MMLQYLLFSHLNNQFHIEMQVMASCMFQIMLKTLLILDFQNCRNFKKKKNYTQNPLLILTS